MLELEKLRMKAASVDIPRVNFTLALVADDLIVCNHSSFFLKYRSRFFRSNWFFYVLFSLGGSCNKLGQYSCLKCKVSIACKLQLTKTLLAMHEKGNWILHERWVNSRRYSLSRHLSSKVCLGSSNFVNSTILSKYVRSAKYQILFSL